MGSVTSLQRRLLAILFPALLALPSLLMAQTDVNATPEAAEKYLLAAANRDRLALGLAQLQRDPMLDRAAATHAVELAKHEDLSHGFTGEPGLVTRALRAGVRFELISENVGQSDDSADLHSMWMRCAEHRDNLLDPEVTTVGISVVVREGELYAVEDFAGTGRAASVKQPRASAVSMLNRPAKPAAARPVAIQSLVSQNVAAKKVLISGPTQRAATASLMSGQ